MCDITSTTYVCIGTSSRDWHAGIWKFIGCHGQKFENNQATNIASSKISASLFGMGKTRASCTKPFFLAYSSIFASMLRNIFPKEAFAFVWALPMDIACTPGYAPTHMQTNIIDACMQEMTSRSGSCVCADEGVYVRKCKEKQYDCLPNLLLLPPALRTTMCEGHP